MNQDKPQPPPVPPDPAVMAIECAQKIVSDPSNWRDNSVLVTQLGNCAQDLGVDSTQEFREFDSAAQALIQFGTSWTSRLDEAETNQLRTQLSRLTSHADASLQFDAPSDASIIPTDGEVHVNANTKTDTEDVQRKAERLILKTVEGLRAAQADEFGKLFARAQSAYRALRSVLLQKRKTASG